MKLKPLFAAAIILTTTPAFAAPNGSRMPVGDMPIEFSRRPLVGKGMTMLPTA